MRRLETEGLIDRRVTLLNARKLPEGQRVHPDLAGQAAQGPLDVFEREIAVLPEIMECYLMSGDADYLVRALVPDVDALERLIVEHITRIPGVASIRSSFALKQVLYTRCRWPKPAQTHTPRGLRDAAMPHTMKAHGARRRQAPFQRHPRTPCPKPTGSPAAR